MSAMPPARSSPRLISPAAVKARVTPPLLRHLNERAIFEVLRENGAMSRSEISRQLSVSVPTVSKAVANLLRARLVEEVPDPTQPLVSNGQQSRRTGRPSVWYDVARHTAQVLGVEINVRRCSLVRAELDGTICEDSTFTFATPKTYKTLLTRLVEAAGELMAASPRPTLGIGVSVPGEVDVREERIVLSPNLPMTNGQRPAEDLREALAVPTVLVHETDATCRAEQAWGQARGLQHFAIISTYEGLGASFVCNGRMLRGATGLAGELGHTTVRPDGRRCGCGNYGCLETEATDGAFARRVSERLGRPIEVEQALQEAAEGTLDVREELHATLDYLAIGVANAINLFEPQRVLICSRMFDGDASIFEYLVAQVRRRAMQPQGSRCELQRAMGDNLRGSVAAILHKLTCSIGPKLP